MSTIQASNVSDGTTTVGTGYVVNGSAKAWVTFGFPSGTTTIRNSLNVSSVTDIGTGVHDVNFTTSFSTNEYAATVGTWQSTSVTGVSNNLGIPSASTQRIETRENNAAVDPNYVHMIVQGDLA